VSILYLLQLTGALVFDTMCLHTPAPCLPACLPHSLDNAQLHHKVVDQLLGVTLTQHP
jgi:hypothetical protein